MDHTRESITASIIDAAFDQQGIGTATKVEKEEITTASHFKNDLGFDSLDDVELVMEIEDDFNLSIPDEEAEKITTVGQAVDYVVNALGITDAKAAA